MKLRLFMAAVACAAVASAVPAWAITFGGTDGNAHPNVGALYTEVDGQKFQICSGSLIAPYVFLTAAHCTAFLEAQDLPALVAFDSAVDESSAFIPGTMTTHPAFLATRGFAQSPDIAVVELASTPAGVEPVELPDLGLLDELGDKNGLKRQTFTAVGYGVVREAKTGPPFAQLGEAGGIRMAATSTFDALNPSWLRLSQNPSTGGGGTCFGDSGGPNFLGSSNVVASLTVTGDRWCRSTNVTFRLDTEVAHTFLAPFLATAVSRVAAGEADVGEEGDDAQAPRRPEPQEEAAVLSAAEEAVLDDPPRQSTRGGSDREDAIPVEPLEQRHSGYVRGYVLGLVRSDRVADLTQESADEPDRGHREDGDAVAARLR